jgi:hypothetical protein
MFRHMIAVTALFLALAGNNSSAQSQQPQSQNPPAAPQQPTAEQRGTEKAPFVVEIRKHEQTQNGAGADNTDREKQRDDGWFAGWSLSDRIAGIASAAAFLQFLALIATVFITVRNGRRQLRAYILPHGATIIDGMMLDPPQPARANIPGIVLSFKNSGQTPAYKIASWMKIELEERINEGRMNAPKLEQRFTTNLGPGGEMPKVLWFERALVPAEIADVVSGAKAIYVYGRIEYNDIFKYRRYATFRLGYSGPFPPPKGVVFSHCESGNDAD